MRSMKATAFKIWPGDCGDRRGLRPERDVVLYTPPTAKPGLAVYRGAGEVGRALLLP